MKGVPRLKRKDSSLVEMRAATVTLPVEHFNLLRKTATLRGVTLADYFRALVAQDLLSSGLLDLSGPKLFRLSVAVTDLARSSEIVQRKITSILNALAGENVS